MARIIYLSNSANQAFQAIVLPCLKLSWSDIFCPSTGLGAQALGEIKNAEDFYNWYKNAGAGLWTPEQAKIMSQFFDSFGTRIIAGESKAIFDSEKLNCYFNSQQWSNFQKIPKCWVFLRSKDGKYTSAFGSESDHAWITQGKGQSYEAIRAKSGKVWHADPSLGQHSFVKLQTTAGF